MNILTRQHPVIPYLSLSDEGRLFGEIEVKWYRTNKSNVPKIQAKGEKQTPKKRKADNQQQTASKRRRSRNALENTRDEMSLDKEDREMQILVSYRYGMSDETFAKLRKEKKDTMCSHLWMNFISAAC